MLSCSRSTSSSSDTGSPPREQLRLGALGELDEPLGVPLSHAPMVSLFEPVERVVADRLEHDEPRAPVALPPPQQAVVDQRCKHGEVGLADAFGGRHRAAADEHGELRESVLLALVQQVEAPLDRLRERRLACGCVARRVAEQLVLLVESFEQLAGVEHVDAGGRELERERQPVEPPADRGHRRAGRVVERERRDRRPGRAR